MTFDRHALKNRAKRRIGESRLRILLIAACYVLILFILSGIILRVSGYMEYATRVTGAYLEVLEKAEELAANGPLTDEMLADLQMREVTPPKVSAAAWVLAAALYIFMMVLDVGFDGFCLFVSRGEASSLRQLFSSFGVFTKAFVICLLKALAVAVGCLLFIIPGIFTAYRFRMAFYIMYDHPELGPVACLRRSSQLMKGNCMEIFILDLSFIGWILGCRLVSLIGLPLLDIWVRPYMGLTCANYYNAMIRYIGDPAAGTAPQN